MNLKANLKKQPFWVQDIVKDLRDALEDIQSKLDTAEEIIQTLEDVNESLVKRADNSLSYDLRRVDL